MSWEAGSKAGVTWEILLLPAKCRPYESCVSVPRNLSPEAAVKNSGELCTPRFFLWITHSFHKYLCIRRLCFRLSHIRGNFRTRLSRCEATDNFHLRPNLHLSLLEPYHSKVHLGTRVVMLLQRCSVEEKMSVSLSARA